MITSFIWNIYVLRENRIINRIKWKASASLSMEQTFKLYQTYFECFEFRCTKQNGNGMSYINYEYFHFSDGFNINANCRNASWRNSTNLIECIFVVNEYVYGNRVCHSDIQKIHGQRNGKHLWIVFMNIYKMHSLVRVTCECDSLEMRTNT